jgi:hypothetical protein
MPRYYFHIVSRTNPVCDVYGVELAGLDAAHWHAMRLVYRLREHAPETSEDWVVAVSDESGARPLVVLPRAVPMLREASPSGERLKWPPTSSQCRQGLTASARESLARRP